MKRIVAGLLLLSSVLLLTRAGMYRYALPIGEPQRPDTLAVARVTSSAGKTRIYVENVDLWSYDKDINPDVQVLTGNVVFSHNNGYMYCDSAHLNEKTNSFEAFGNVRFEQGDTLHIYCERMHYDGQTMLAQLRQNVRMEHRDNTLFTDSFDYSRSDGVGYYFDYGTIVDPLNSLSSLYGEYFTTTKEAFFYDEVKLSNDDLTLTSDTLYYHTETKVATILGPTRIESADGVIHTTRGVYDTLNDKAYLMQRPRLYSGTRTLTGDSLYYDRNAKVAQVYRHVILADTVDKVELRGGYVEYHELSDFGLARDSAYLVDHSSPDTLYVHAHEVELSKVDTLYNQVRGKGNVRLYRHDVQAVCDTLIYSTVDSIAHCVGSPYIWNGKSQISGSLIKMMVDQGEVREAHVVDNAIVAQQLDRVHVNQMKGNLLRAYFANKQIDSLRVEGNAETIYYNVEADSTISAHVKTQSAAIFIRFASEDIDHIKVLEDVQGAMTPLPLLPAKDKFFEGFYWFGEARPTSPRDIFRATPRPRRDDDA